LGQVSPRTLFSPANSRSTKSCIFSHLSSRASTLLLHEALVPMEPVSPHRETKQDIMGMTNRLLFFYETRTA
jgi:hypothetical protein